MEVGNYLVVGGPQGPILHWVSYPQLSFYFQWQFFWEFVNWFF